MMNMANVSVPTAKVVYKLFGIPVWSVTKIIDIEPFYAAVSDRFTREMADLIGEARGANDRQ